MHLEEEEKNKWFMEGTSCWILPSLWTLPIDPVPMTTQRFWWYNLNRLDSMYNIYIYKRFRRVRPPDYGAICVFIGTMNNYGHWKIFRNPQKLLSNMMLELSVCVSHFLSLAPSQRGNREVSVPRFHTVEHTGRAFMPSQVSHKVKNLLLW